MKFRQAKKIVYGNSSVHDKYRKRRPPKKEQYVDEETGNIIEVLVWPTLDDIDIIRRAVRTFVHHYKKHKKKDLK